MKVPAIIGGVVMNSRSYTFLANGESHGFDSVSGLRRSLSSEGRLPGKWSNFGRFPQDAQRFCLGCALALEQTLPADESARRATGIVTTDDFEHEHDQYDYFRDYVDGGRQLGRSSLFVHTLPTSAAADASVCLGLGGPLLYWRDEEEPMVGLLKIAESFICDGSADNMIAAYRKGEKLLCLVLGDGSRHKELKITSWSDII